MANPFNQPRKDDAVLGSQALPPVGGVILGGIEGVKMRLGSAVVEQRIAALYETSNYGDTALDLVIRALQDESVQVRWTAYSLLKDRAELNIKQVVQENLPSLESLDADCIRLGGLLALRRWKEADQETAAIMLKVSGREQAGSLRFADIECFPPQLLQTIDQLWLGYSYGHFGLSVQRQIWQSMGGSEATDYEIWYRFCDRLGWRVNDYWINYDRFTFNLDAPQGHLPFLIFGGFGVVVCLQTLFSKLEK